MIALGLLLAIVSTVAINGGYAWQHDAASTLPPLTVRHPVRSLLSLFRNRRWFAGFAAGIGGWVLYVVALRIAPLSLVQAAAAGGIAVLAVGLVEGAADWVLADQSVFASSLGFMVWVLVTATYLMRR